MTSKNMQSLAITILVMVILLPIYMAIARVFSPVRLAATTDFGIFLHDSLNLSWKQVGYLDVTGVSGPTLAIIIAFELVTFLFWVMVIWFPSRNENSKEN